MKHKDTTWTKYDELVLVSFGQFQIGFLSTKVDAIKQLCSFKVLVSERKYESIGWLFHNNCHLGWLQAIEVQPKVGSAYFNMAPQVEPETPLSFEVISDQPLPKEITSLSHHSCLFPENIAPYCTIFRRLRPNRIKVCPLTKTIALHESLKQFLRTEEALISNSHTRSLSSSFPTPALDFEHKEIHFC